MTAIDGVGERPEAAWAAIDDDVPGDLIALARRCLAADGGLPVAADPRFLRRRWAAPGGVRFGLRGSSGELVAAAVVAPGPDGPIVTALVDPAARGRGVGARLLDHALAIARSASVAGSGSAPSVAGSGSAAAAGLASTAGVAPVEGTVSDCAPVVTVETESLTAAAAVLFATRGLRPIFGEDVLRIDLAGFAQVPDWPAGTALTTWSGAAAERFFKVYQASFRGRPGFPDPTATEWIDDNESDDEFRPDWSLLAALDGRDAGFVTAAIGWIVQVGVIPPARGRGLARALLIETLRRMAADDQTEAWLNVNVDNPGAAALYRHIGFTDRGRRARYRI